jgi:hypothetical protein
VPRDLTPTAPPNRPISKAIRKRLGDIVATAIVGGIIGGVLTGQHYARNVRNAGNVTSEVKLFKAQYEKAFEKLEQDGILTEQSKMLIRGTKRYTIPIAKAKIITYIGARGAIDRVDLVDVVANPKKYREQYGVLKKYLTDQAVSEVNRLIKMEPKVRNEVEQIRKREQRARMIGRGKGALGGVAAGAGTAGLLYGAAAMKRKLGQRRRR